MPTRKKRSFRRNGSPSRSRKKAKNRFRSRSRRRSRNKYKKNGRGGFEQRRFTIVPRMPPPSAYSFPHPANLASLSFIHPNLYLTCMEGAMRYQGQNIAIVAAGTRNVTDYMKHHDSFYRAFVIADDTPHMCQDDFVSIFGVGADLLHKALGLNKITLLHCRAGINRSVALALAYVKRYTNLNVNDVLKKIRQVNNRKRALPALINRTFAKHLGPFH